MTYQTIYIVTSMVGGVSQGVEAFHSYQDAQKAFRELVEDWNECDTITNGQGDPTTVSAAVEDGYCGSGDGDDDAYLWEVEVK